MSWAETIEVPRKMDGVLEGGPYDGHDIPDLPAGINTISIKHRKKNTIYRVRRIDDGYAVLAYVGDDA